MRCSMYMFMQKSSWGKCSYQATKLIDSIFTNQNVSIRVVTLRGNLRYQKWCFFLCKTTTQAGDPFQWFATCGTQYYIHTDTACPQVQENQGNLFTV